MIPSLNKRLLRNFLLQAASASFIITSIAAAPTLQNELEQSKSWEIESFDPGAGQYQDVQLAADDEIHRITLRINVKEAHVHERWSSMVALGLVDMEEELRIRFRVSRSVKKVGKCVVRIDRDDESEKPHYVESPGFKDYEGEHEMVIEIDDEGNMTFLFDGKVLETHGKQFRIDGIDISAVGTTADVSWAIE